MSYILNETQQIYVLSEDNARGEIRYNKIKVLYLFVKTVVDLTLQQYHGEDVDTQLDDFFAVVPNDSQNVLSAIVESKAIDLISALQDKGLYTITGEESVFGIGVTKELATEAYLNQFPLKIDNWN